MDTYVDDWHALIAARGALEAAVGQARAAGMTEAEMYALIEQESGNTPPERAL